MIGWPARLPVAARMAALTSGALIALLVLFGVSVHRQFGSVLREEVDRKLIEVALFEAVALEDARQQDLADLLLSGVDGRRVGYDTSDFAVQLMSADGSVLAASQGLAGLDGLVRGGALVRVAAGVPVYGDATLKGRNHRFVGVSVDDSSGRIVAVAEPIQNLTDAERALMAAYIPAAAAAGLLALIAGWWITKRSLAPLRTLAAEAEAIGALDLSQRLPAAPTSDEIGRLGMTLNRMLDRLDAALQRERQLTAEVGHELRTPLAIIRAELELLLDALTDKELPTGIESMLEEVDRTAGVIEDMLLLARADANVVLDRREGVDLGELARTVARRFSAVAASEGAALRASGEGHIQGDARAIERAVANLVDNALRHTPEGGAVEIEVEQRDNGALLRVRDTGPGATSDGLATMFDRYARAGPRRGAAGLGLSIVAAVAASHRGNVQARNSLEGGLEITVELQ
jgi:signal transduction histidine kinase